MCRDFAAIVGAIRGPGFATHRRHFYTVAGTAHKRPLGASQCGERLVVTAAFFPSIVRLCRQFLDHIADIELDARAAHLHDFPVWLAEVAGTLDDSRVIGFDAAVRGAGVLLGMSVRAVYAQIRAGGDSWGRCC